MAKGNPASLKMAINNTDNKRKVNLILFPSHLKSLNFNANKGKGETISQENKNVIAIRTIPLTHPTGNNPAREGIPQMNSEWAGVGTPIKESLWRVSTLNFANRRAAKTASNKPNHDH